MFCSKIELFEYLTEHENLLSLQPVHPQNADFFDYLKELVALLDQFGFLQIRGLENEQFSKSCAELPSLGQGGHL